MASVSRELMQTCLVQPQKIKEVPATIEDEMDIDNGFPATPPSPSWLRICAKKQPPQLRAARALSPWGSMESSKKCRRWSEYRGGVRRGTKFVVAR